MDRGLGGFRAGPVLVVLAVWCLSAGGLAVPVVAQSGEGVPVPGVPPAGEGGLEAGQVDGAVGSGGDGFVGWRLCRVRLL
ncbi:MAG: hypothetical protein OXG67_06385 [bacterium]|nr:hypothetical protein [bacterium]MCY3889414.1 hypothetical protein [bacterium]